MSSKQPNSPHFPPTATQAGPPQGVGHLLPPSSPCSWEALQQHLTFPASLGRGEKLHASSLAPRQQGVPFLCLLLAQTPAAPQVYGGGMVHKEEESMPRHARGALTRRSYMGMCTFGGRTKALWLSPRTRQGPDSGLPRALWRPWIFIVSENRPFTGSRWKV